MQKDLIIGIAGYFPKKLDFIRVFHCDSGQITVMQCGLFISSVPGCSNLELENNKIQ